MSSGIKVSKDFFPLYKERLQKGETVWSEYYKKLKYERQAYLQEIPDDISASASEAAVEVGNDPTGAMKSTHSQMLVPMYTAITKKTREAFSAMPLRFEYEANSQVGLLARRAIQIKLREVYTRANMAASQSKAFNYVGGGLIISQTVYKTLDRKVRIDGQTKSILTGGGIDVEIYDPLRVVLDWNAKIGDIRNTSEFCIVTIGDFTAEGIKAKYGFEIAEGEGNGSGGGSTPRAFDSYKKTLEEDVGENLQNTYPVREYYLKDGSWYTIVNDTYVVNKSFATNGDADRIPINAVVLFPTPDSHMGMTLWDYLKWPVALMSCAVNQVADNNAMNNNAPYLVSKGLGLGGYSMGDFEGDFLEFNPIGGKNFDIKKYMDRPQIREVTDGAAFMYNKGMEQLFYVAGSTPMDFGVQDKQIRTAGVAEMVSQAIVRSDSDLAVKMENGYMNPTTWDIVQIFYTHYEDFGFDPDSLPREFLENPKAIRVVNGSYLKEDQITRLNRISILIQQAQLDPQRWKWEDLMYEFSEALGVIDPYVYIKTPEEATKERLALMAMQIIGEKGAQDEQVQQIVAQLAELSATTARGPVE